MKTIRLERFSEREYWKENLFSRKEFISLVRHHLQYVTYWLEVAKTPVLSTH